MKTWNLYLFDGRIAHVPRWSILLARNILCFTVKKLLPRLLRAYELLESGLTWLGWYYVSFVISIFPKLVEFHKKWWFHLDDATTYYGLVWLDALKECGKLMWVLVHMQVSNIYTCSCCFFPSHVASYEIKVNVSICHFFL
jgi:hypothetical protein